MGAGTRRAAFASAIVAMLGIAACRQLVGIGDQPPGGGADGGSAEAAATCGDFPWSTGACQSCVENACCAEATACRGDPGCAPTLDCMARCAGSDDVCRSACFTQGDAVIAALASCQATSCASDCSLQCGGFFGLVQGETADPCLSCLVAEACPFATQCAQSASCLENGFCTGACDSLDPVCQQNCAATVPVDLPDAGAGFANANAACTSACQLGTNWSCAGHVVWPMPTTPSIAFQVRVADSVSFRALAGATVRACQNSDADCLTPLSTATTDSNGLATLTSSSLPFLGFVEATAGGYVTSLAYSYPALAESTAPGVTVAVGLVTQAYLAEVSAAAGVALDPKLGIIFVVPHDCADFPAPGVSFSGTGLGAAAQVYYEISGSPTTHATATTLPGPAGGFINVAPGLVTVVASANGMPVASGAVQVRANAFTNLQNVVPTP